VLLVLLVTLHNFNLLRQQLGWMLGAHQYRHNSNPFPVPLRVIAVL
jgi:hypothetical protein